MKDLLRGKLTEKEAESAKKSFDLVGDIAILEIPDGLERKERAIADAILKTHPYIKTVCKKAGDRKGRLRTRKLKIIFSKDRKNPTETIHREYGYKIKLDVARVYFSPREGTERQRIAAQAKPGEMAAVLFAGAGPYAIAIGKKQPDIRAVYAVELNKTACRYMEENTKLNGLNYKIIPFCGDAKNIVPKLGIKFDRIVMPLPLEGYKYLPTVLKQLKPGGMVHFYCVGKKENLFKKPEKIIEKECRKLGIKFRVLNRQKVLPYGPGAYKVCIDFQVL